MNRRMLCRTRCLGHEKQHGRNGSNEASSSGALLVFFTKQWHSPTRYKTRGDATCSPASLTGTTSAESGISIQNVFALDLSGSEEIAEDSPVKEMLLLWSDLKDTRLCCNFWSSAATSRTALVLFAGSVQMLPPRCSAGIVQWNVPLFPANPLALPFK